MSPLPTHERGLPLLLRKQRETLLCFSHLSMECSCIAIAQHAYIAGGAATQGEILPVAAYGCGFMALSLLGIKKGSGGQK